MYETIWWFDMAKFLLHHIKHCKAYDSLEHSVRIFILFTENVKLHFMDNRINQKI